MKDTTFVMLVFTITTIGVAHAPVAKAEIVTTSNLRYAEAPGTTAGAQSLDIYAPKGSQKLPVLVYVHGGGWKGGDKLAVGTKTAFFTSAGWVFVSINYRLLPAGKHPNNVQDVAAALAWIHSNIARYGGDPARLFLMGHSSGAHLVALVATDERRLEATGKSLDILKGVIPLDTSTYDLPLMMKSGASLPNLTSTAEGIFGSDPQGWRDASPYYHVSGGKKVPPFLIFYSRGTGVEGENRLRVEQAQAFGEALRKAGASAEVFDASDRNHGEINAWFSRPNDSVTAKAMEFVNSLAGVVKAGGSGIE